MAFADAEIKSGIDFVLDCVDFDQRVKSADLVIVGEGRMDSQSYLVRHRSEWLGGHHQLFPSLLSVVV